MLEGDREKFSRELTDAEDWLYEDGEFADKKTYIWANTTATRDSSLLSQGQRYLYLPFFVIVHRKRE